MAFQLKITKGKGHGKSFQFDKDAVRIGRLPDNDLVLYDTGVSRYHCELVRDNGTFTLRDTGSANGTRLNDSVTTEGVLQDGDEIGVGPITFVFRRVEALPPDKRRLTSSQSVSAPDDDRARREMEADRTTAFHKDDLPSLEEMRGGGDTGVDAVSVARTATGSFLAYKKGMQGFKKLPRSTRLALVAATAVVVTAMVVSAYIVNNQPPPDRSQEIFPLDGDTALLRFGFGPVDVSTPDRANFKFTYGGGRVTISYTAGGIQSAKELEILVNGKHVGFVEAAPRWQKGLTTELPRDLLVPGQNVITFENAFNPGREEKWGLTQLQMVQQALPTPDPHNAKRLFELGQGAFETRSVAPQNLYKSIEYFSDAALFLEALEKPPPLLADIRAAQKTSSEELQRIHDEHMFAAQKAVRFGDTAQAVDTLRNLLRYYPNADDRRHVEVKMTLGKILGDM